MTQFLKKQLKEDNPVQIESNDLKKISQMIIKQI